VVRGATSSECGYSLFLLDTNTLSYFLRGNGGVAERLLEVEPSQVALPAPVVYEIEYGVRHARLGAARRRRIGEALTAFTVCPIDAAAARAAAELRVRAETRGTPLGPIDTLIAGIALAGGHTLVTHNLREFAQVDGLKFVDWHD